MFIEPIQSLHGISEITKLGNKTEEKNNEFTFKSVFENVVNNYVASENQVDEDITKLSTGETDDFHNLMINTQKAEVSLDLMLQLRSKALDAYNEIMRVGV